MDNLYFIAILPPDEIQVEVTHFKQQAWELFHTRHALKSPPHITIVPPQRWNEQDLQWIKAQLSAWIALQKPFSIHLSGFAAFKPRVIYVRVLSSSFLSDLQSGCVQCIRSGLEKEDHRPYHPHMTVAFKDLDRRKFGLAWDYFNSQPYETVFEVDALTLLRHHAGRWQVEGRWLLSKPDGFIKG